MRGAIETASNNSCIFIAYIFNEKVEDYIKTKKTLPSKILKYNSDRDIEVILEGIGL